MPKLVGNVISSFGSEKIANKLGLNDIDETKDETEMSEKEYYERFELKLKRDIVLHASGIILSQPFHVISVRMMAQFVGREAKYTSVFGSILEIWREEGVFGLFSGLIPRLLGDMACLILASTTTFYINKHFIKTTEERKYVGGLTHFTQFVYASILYPFHLVSTCMIVSGSG
jgi:mitochondrial carrier